jgi:F0F1-type ATP synthase membrane subunit b/b'
MRRRKKRFDTFSLSFLDCMSCGFGAVVLFFMIISATMAVRQDELNKNLSERADSLKVEVSAGELNLVELRNRIEQTEKEQVEAQGLARRIVALLEQKREELARLDKDTTSQEAHINKLKADLKQLEEANRRLAAASASPSDLGSRIRQIEGEGQRQYLTGLKVGGERVMVLLDTSASMLDEDIVNVIRRRNMPDAQKIRAPKWQRALRTVEWVVAQFEPGTKFQIVSFNTQAVSVLPDTDGRWLDASDPKVVESAMTATRRHEPASPLRRRPRDQPATRQHRAHRRQPADPGRVAAQERNGFRPGAAQEFQQRPRQAAGRRAGQCDPVPDGRRRRGVDRVLAPRSAERRLVHQPVQGLAMTVGAR